MKEEIFGNHLPSQPIVPSVRRPSPSECFLCSHFFEQFQFDIFSIIDLDSSEEVQADTAEYMIYKISEKP